jgi:hypothetical protein
MPAFDYATRSCDVCGREVLEDDSRDNFADWDVLSEFPNPETGKRDLVCVGCKVLRLRGGVNHQWERNLFGATP